MKKMFFHINRTIIGLAFIAGSFASCKKLIEIPANPPSQITQKEQFADSATAMTAIAGVYAYNVGHGFGYSDAGLTYTTGLSADELAYTQNNDNQQYYNYSLTPLNSEIINLWSYPYQSIYQVNDVLKGVVNNNNLSAPFQKQISGEMEVLRALYYFNMVNLFGGVPLVTTTDYNATARIPKATPAAIYAQVMSDLANARKKLTVAYPSSGRARPNLYTAIALQAKVNLYQKQWPSAYHEADSVIASGLYDVTNTPLNGVFLDGSNEAIWQLPANQGYYGVADAQYFIPSFSAPNFSITTPLLDAFEAGDQRKVDWISSTVVNSNTVYYPYKYKNVSASTTPTEDQMVLRLGEIYLIRAEAQAEGAGNGISGAIADLNIIRKRAGLQNYNGAADQTSVLNAIMHERQVELFCEWGNRWYDLKRTGTAATVLGAEKTGYTANAALYPIPQSQILLDNLLIQNPGY